MRTSAVAGVRRAEAIGSGNTRAALSLLACTLLWPEATRAEELGTQYNLTFAAERLFGLYIDNQSVGDNDVDYSVVALGWNRQASSSSLSTPRLGVDFFLTDGFTVGGVLGFFSHNQDARGTSNTTTGVLFGARAGYALRLGHAVSFWPRGGFTYATVNSDAGADQHLFALTIDAPFTLSPAEHVAILAGPVLELVLTGKQSRIDYDEVLFGLMLGLTGWVGL